MTNLFTEITPRRWTKQRPKFPSAYYVRGFEWGEPEQAALIEVREYQDELVCNLHEANSDTSAERMGHWFSLTELTEELEWCGPLTVPPQ